MEHTCVLLKPDAVDRGLCGEIISRFEKKGLHISGCKMMMMNDVLIKNHYAHVAKEDFFEGLQKFMKSAPVLALILSGDNSIEIVRKMSGTTNHEQGTIRGDFAISSQKNIIHSSDSTISADKEIQRFFEPHEIFER